MKKNMIIALFFTLVFSVSSLIATPTIFKNHKPRLKAGKNVVTGCGYCHNKTTGLKKAPGQDIKKIQKGQTCTGSGCHK